MTIQHPSVWPFFAEEVITAAVPLAAFTLYDETPALFMIATMAMLLLLVGIHNAWDTVTFIVTQRSNKAAASESK